MYRTSCDQRLEPMYNLSHLLKRLSHIRSCVKNLKDYVVRTPYFVFRHKIYARLPPVLRGGLTSQTTSYDELLLITLQLIVYLPVHTYIYIYLCIYIYTRIKGGNDKTRLQVRSKYSLIPNLWGVDRGL